MRNIKSGIVRYMVIIMTIMTIVMISATVAFQIIREKRQTTVNAVSLMEQVQSVLSYGMANGSGQENDVAFIFKMLAAGNDAELYSLNPDTLVIEASTRAEDVGKSINKIGIRTSSSNFETGFELSAKVNGVPSYCVVRKVDGVLMAYVIPNSVMFDGLLRDVIILGAGVILISVILAVAVTWYIDNYIITKLQELNVVLADISAGDLSKNVRVGGNFEFYELSSYINEMVRSLVRTTETISYALNKTNMRIGVYMYNLKVKKVRYTEYIPGIFSFNAEKTAEIFSDRKLFEDFIDDLRKNPVEGEDDVFALSGEEKYIRLDEIVQDNDVFGVAIDVTRDVKTRRLIETERDADMLTGILNRRGMANKVSELTADSEKIKKAVLLMVDADGLKSVNDKYGHDKGDLYINEIAHQISAFGKRENMSARIGGDEFAVLLYGYEDEKERRSDIDAFMAMQDESYILIEGDRMPVRFSAGYVLADSELDFEEYLKIADERMYMNKKARKTGRD